MGSPTSSQSEKLPQQRSKPRWGGVFWLQEAQLSGTKETTGHPFFRSAAVRLSWRFYAQRLTRAARWLLLPSLAFVGYSLSSLELQAYRPMAYFAGFWLVALCATLLFRPKVKLKALHGERACAGSVLPVEVLVEQSGRLGGLDLRVLPHRLPPGIDADPPAGADLEPLRRGEAAVARLGLYCAKRGVYQLHGFKVETDYPFGLFRAYSFTPQERTLLVYPAFTRLRRLELPSGRLYQPGGVALASSLGESAEFIGNREFRDGDNVRNLDWRASARLDKLIVREYREEYFVRVALVLDTFVPKKAARARRADFERAVSVCAAVGDYLARQEYIVDLFAAGPNLYHLTAGRGLAYLDQILDILACVDESGEEPFRTIEPEIAEHLAQISALVCVFLEWNEERRRFVYNLRAQGVAVKVVIVRDAPCGMDPSGESGGSGHVPVLSAADLLRGVEEL